MNKVGIKSVSYIPLCSTEEIKLEIKKPTGNETVKKMWDKLDDEEQGFINVMIDRDNKQNEEIERLNNIINDLLKRQNEALNYISNFLSMDNRYKHGNGNDELELVRRILNKHNQELDGSDKE